VTSALRVPVAIKCVEFYFSIVMDKFVTKRRKHEEVAVPKEVQLDGKNGQKNDVTRSESDPAADIPVNKPGKYTGSATVRVEV
jgi:hypothetical protein